MNPQLNAEATAPSSAGPLGTMIFRVMVFCAVTICMVIISTALRLERGFDAANGHI